jgi:hypothetical protein
MRLSATERIMREAERHDDDVVEPASDGDTEKVSAVPLASLGFASPRMPPPLGGGVDIDIDIDMEDEEGETQVDAQRSANALMQMRTLEATASDGVSTSHLHLAPPPSPQRGHGVPPGRPPISVAPSPRTTARPAVESAGSSTLTYPRRLLGPAIRPEPIRQGNRSPHLFSSSRLQFGSIDSEPAVPATSDAVLGTPRGVRRRTGILIGVSTAAAVALIAGAWTATQPETIPPVTSAGTLTSRLAATAPKGTAPVAAAPPPTVGVVVATPPAAEVQVEPIVASAPLEATPAPETQDAPPAPVGALPAPEATQAPASVRGSATSKRAAAAAAKWAKWAKKARRASKAQAVDNRRPPKAQKAAASVASKTADRVAGRSDPDETLPPSN